LEDLEETPRNRVASAEELRRLNTACYELGDSSFWSIIGTELTNCLRKADLKTYLMAESENGMVTLTQSKTGLKISLPKEKHPDWAKIWTNFDSRWEKIRRQAGCQDLQFRDLRKTGLRLAAEEEGVSISDVAGLAGHSDEKTTKKHYLNMNEVQGRRNTELVDVLAKRLKAIIEDKP
jgi:integrase